nr:AAA family ATPase [Massilia agrisoli]
MLELARLLRQRSANDEVELVSGTLDRLNFGASQGAPDILLVDEPQGSDLALLEQLGASYPRMATILVAESQSLAFMMQAMRAGVREVLFTDTLADTMFAAVDRIEEKLQQHTHANGKVLAFVSCKGGSGATFLATNLGYALAELGGKRVALIDLNLQFGDASLFVADHKPLATLADVALQMHRLDASLLASSMMAITPNFSVLAAPDDPVHAGDVKPEHIDVLLRLARRHYDFIILDVGRSLDPVSVRALDQADTIYPVLQTTLPYIRDGKRLIEVFRSLGYPKEKIQVIANRHQKKGDIGLRDLESACGTPVFMSIPNHYEAAAASVNQGVPVIKLAKGSPIAKSLKGFAIGLAGSAMNDKKGWISTLFNKAPAKTPAPAPAASTETRAPAPFGEKQPWMQKS